MAPALLTRLFCCLGRRVRAPDVESTIIPNETSHLIERPASPAPIIVDHQTLNDKFGSIVRAKEGKMVSVSARTPFTIHSSSNADPASLASEESGSAAIDSHAITSPRTTTSRRPPVLVMTPAQMSVGRGSETPYMRTHSLYSSPAASRSSSRRPRPRSPSAHSAQSTNSSKARATHPNSTPNSDRARLPAASASSERIAESGSEVSVEEEVEPSSLIPIAHPPAAASNAQGITFSWDDT
ncbi:hypothetical protein C8R44DRAFT_141480 [Mycena epipterygia]|nr:hypothetical protein C8R44DRAFT_141480 [Mycena epipterygia]